MWFRLITLKKFEIDGFVTRNVVQERGSQMATWRLRWLSSPGIGWGRWWRRWRSTHLHWQAWSSRTAHPREQSTPWRLLLWCPANPTKTYIESEACQHLATWWSCLTRPAAFETSIRSSILFPLAFVIYLIRQTLQQTKSWSSKRLVSEVKLALCFVKLLQEVSKLMSQCCVPVILLVYPGVIPSNHKVEQHEDLGDEEEPWSNPCHPACISCLIVIHYYKFSGETMSCVSKLLSSYA